MGRLPLDGWVVGVTADGRERPVLADALRATGADVIEIPVYEWELPADPSPARKLIVAVCERRVDAVTFTSAPALWNCVVLASGIGKADELIAAFNDSV